MVFNINVSAAAQCFRKLPGARFVFLVSLLVSSGLFVVSFSFAYGLVGSHTQSDDGGWVVVVDAKEEIFLVEHDL